MHFSLYLAGLALIVTTVACDKSEDQDSEDTAATSGESATGDTGDTSDTDDTTGGDTTGDDTTGGDDEACNLDECFNSCSITEYLEEAAGEACTRPLEGHEPWNCDMELTCPKVSFGESFDAEEAHCLLTALRDRTPGKLSYEWHPDPITPGWVSNADIFVRADGTVLVDVDAVIIGSCGGHAAYKTRAMDLPAQDNSLWEDCIADDTAEGLKSCLVGEESGYTVLPTEAPMPWLEPTCIDAVPTCE